MFFKKDHTPKLLLAELSLIISSVLIFRSLWTLMDRIEILSDDYVLLALLIIGIATTIPAMRYVIKH